MFRSLLVLVGLVALYAASAMAETYTWEDSSGTLHFADDLSHVPKKYRKKVKVREDMGPDFSTAVESKESATADKEKGSSEGASEKSEKSDKSEKGSAAKPEKGEKKDKLYGGKSGPQWKSEISGLRDQIKSVDEQLEERKRKQSNPGGMSRSDYRNNESSIKALEERQKSLISKLEEKISAAVAAGVPSEYR